MQTYNNTLLWLFSLLRTCLFYTGSTKEETADSSQPSEGAELSLRPQGRKSIGESQQMASGLNRLVVTLTCTMSGPTTMLPQTESNLACTLYVVDIPVSKPMSHVSGEVEAESEDEDDDDDDCKKGSMDEVCISPVLVMCYFTPRSNAAP